MASNQLTFRVSTASNSVFMSEKVDDVIMYTASPSQTLLFGSSQGTMPMLAIADDHANVGGYLNAGTVSTGMLQTSQWGLNMTLWDPQLSNGLMVVEPHNNYVSDPAVSNQAFSASNQAFGICAIGVNEFTFAGSILPSANVTYDLGSSNMRFRDLWLSANSFNIGDSTISEDAVNGGMKVTTTSTGEPAALKVKEIHVGDVTTSNLTVLSAATGGGIAIGSSNTSSAFGPFWFASNGQVGLNTSNLTSDFDVAYGMTVRSNVAVLGSQSNASGASFAAGVAIGGGVTVTGAQSNYRDAFFGSNVFVGSNLTVGGTLNVHSLKTSYSNVTFYTSEEITSNLVVDGTFSASNAATVSGALIVKGGSTLSNAALIYGSFGVVGGDATFSNTVALSVGGKITTTGDVLASSDRTLKTDLTVIGDALAKTLSLTGYTFGRTDEPWGGRYMGLIAQDVQAVAPELVSTDAGGKLVLAYGNVTALLVEAIKELSRKVDALAPAPI